MTPNVVDVAPLGNWAFAGVAAYTELSVSLTVMFVIPVIAGSEMVAVPVEVWPPFMDAGDIDNPIMTGLTFTTIVAVRLTPSKEAVTVPVSSEVTLPPVTVKLLFVSPLFKIKDVGV